MSTEPKQEFSAVFQGLSCIGKDKPYKIFLKPGFEPYAVAALHPVAASRPSPSGTRVHAAKQFRRFQIPTELFRRCTDRTTQAVIRFVRNGWPHPPDITWDLRPFHDERNLLVEVGGLQLHGARVYIPTGMRGDILNRLHRGHMGRTNCLGRAKTSLWWPGSKKK
ncbi:hypothetical protein J437_LFUL015170 [Ladona fulva]|uniref:RNA-directed DNA polymerase n=1 Tax=Ladona fulva TaxID=123851 RepID=A0A8K0P7D1_LADFU|nr:hypothetical protein J437_LFUL015170 [Ladona fulva]